MAHNVPRKKAATDASPLRSLLPDVIQHIATFIPETHSFFAFLRAFQATNSLGDLQVLYDLSLACDDTYDALSVRMRRHDLWPKLRLPTVDATSAPSLQRVTKYFRTIHMQNPAEDVALIRMLLGPQNDLAVHECIDEKPTPEALKKWYADLATLPITHLGFTEMEHSIPSDKGKYMVDILPRLDSLRSLNLIDVEGAHLSKAIKYVRTSTLTRLSIGYEHTEEPMHLTDTMVRDIAHWLSSNRVESFRLSHCTFDEGEDAMQAFFHAVFLSEIESVELDLLSLSAIEFCEFVRPIQVSSLVLSRISMYPDEAEILFEALRESKITTLEFSQFYSTQDGFKALGEALPLAKELQSLTFVMTNVGDAGCDMVAAALPSIPHLTKLTLHECCISDAGVALLANVMLDGGMPLRSLHLTNNLIGFAGAVGLVQCLGLRPSGFDDLMVTGIETTEALETTLKHMANMLPGLKRCKLAVQRSDCGIADQLEKNTLNEYWRTYMQFRDIATRPQRRTIADTLSTDT
ncbi:Aste57867_10224 [Aphanomyces stellatus]|uniref:Aste57867_10224 protein n=1 Tax=Aphanomyces stellatus TaxID=120398 RepID=A0A485KQC1_9STRA|nr:hypothetical protein As57867_010185 [Aphanomyces stellatus]VFT87099.1 Aste57867_10224 [Aphanomyces stellatus]